MTFSKALKIEDHLADISFSVYSDLFPISDKCTRVKLFAAGVFTEKIEPDEHGNITKITCASHLDIGLPKSLNNIARKFAGVTIPPLTKKINTELRRYLG